ncbi:MAG: exo-alpha-sialidase [Rhodospirillales bacterium]|nr:exo-alpha-sialidase [Rhodospirillales bacterium]
MPFKAPPQAEDVFEHAPFAAAHASTIAETPSGLIAAWFAGTREGHGDVGIWVARRGQEQWLHPAEVADGRIAFRRRFPCWNPVLFQPSGAPLLLFYKVGPSPSRWWGMVMTSEDDGRSWTEPRRLPDGILGPIKNKPILLADGRLLCPSSDEANRWRLHMEWTDCAAESWQRGPALNDGRSFAAIQPTLLPHGGGRLQLLCRTRQGAIGECWSSDGGQTWTELAPTELPNPDSGIDAVSLADGRALLIYNHSQTARTPLNLAISDNGHDWAAAMVLEHQPGEYSYPAIIQGADGMVHVTYTWNRRRIRHVTISLDSLDLRPIVHGLWPD